MTTNHPVSDLVSTIKNGQMARLMEVETWHSKLKVNILDAMAEEGYISGYEEFETSVVGRKKAKKDGNFKRLRIKLAYFNGNPVIKNIQVMSKPSRRVYSKSDDIPSVFNGLGNIILSTPEGVLPDYKARDKKLGGEMLFKIF